MTQAAALPVEPEWGHKLAIWDTGRTIRVPLSIFPQLRERGFLIRNKPILSPAIAPALKDRNLDPIMIDLRQVLGEDLSGPSTVTCRCLSCQRKISDIDHTRRPGRDPHDEMEASLVVADVVGRRKKRK